MEAEPQVWQRLVVVSHRLTRLCDLVRSELVYNRARRDAWFAHTIAWKKAWLYGETGNNSPSGAHPVSRLERTHLNAREHIVSPRESRHTVAN